MREKRLVPDFIFESSWEVCNKMGGIYTVLSTRAKTLQEQYHDNLLFIGPDLWQEKKNPLFLEDATMWQPWVKMAAESGFTSVQVVGTSQANHVSSLLTFSPTSS